MGKEARLSRQHAGPSPAAAENKCRSSSSSSSRHNVYFLGFFLLGLCFAFVAQNFGTLMHQTQQPQFQDCFLNQATTDEAQQQRPIEDDDASQLRFLPLPQQYNFAIVTDLDKGSRNPQKFEWHSLMTVRMTDPISLNLFPSPTTRAA